VAASFLGTSLLGVFFFSAGTFIAPLEQAFHWSRTQITASFIIFAIVGALLSPPVGMMLDKWGTRRMALCGAPLVGLGFALFSTLNGSIFQWLGYWLLLAICSQFIMVTVWSKAIANNFSKSRGLALSLAMMGNGVTTIVAPVLANYLIENFGWRTAYFALGLGWGGLVTVTSFFMLHDHRGRQKAATVEEQQPAAPLTGYTVSEGLRSVAFVKIVVSVVLCNILNIGLIVHLVQILAWAGLPRDTAVWITSSLGISMMVGTFSFGLVGDRLPAKWVTAFTVAAPAISCALLLRPGLSVLQGAIAANFFGLVIGAQMPSYTYLSTRQFGMRSFGALQGFGNTATSIATALAPAIAAMVFDRTGSYSTYLLAGIPLCVVAAILLLTLGREPQFEPAAA
jgi:MFS family permease